MKVLSSLLHLIHLFRVWCLTVIAISPPFEPILLGASLLLFPILCFTPREPNAKFMIVDFSMNLWMSWCHCFARDAKRFATIFIPKLLSIKPFWMRCRHRNTQTEREGIEAKRVRVAVTAATAQPQSCAHLHFLCPTEKFKHSSHFEAILLSLIANRGKLLFFAVRKLESIFLCCGR